MDKVIKCIDNVPVYKDEDFENNYVLFKDWFKNYLEADINLYHPEDLAEEYNNFECWCEKHELTPHKIYF